MATLYVSNFPDSLYRALGQQAKRNHRSIAAETTFILEQTVLTKSQLKRRAAFYEQLKKIRRMKPALGPGPSVEEMLREDRGR